MPAASWAAKSGDAVLFTEAESLPRATRQAIRRHERPRIYVLGPERVISSSVERSLRRLGRVKRIQGRTPVTNAIAFARYSDPTFGWGVRDPGPRSGVREHRTARRMRPPRPRSRGAASTGRCCCSTPQTLLPRQLENYLLDIQPGYRFDPVRGVYNHAWILGDESAISLGVQSRIDELSEIVRVRDEAL